MKTTVFTKYHIAAGAKMAEFAGYNMPIEFTGINDEHMAVRDGAGVFDVSHMGEIWVKGPRALDLLQRITTNDVSKLFDGKVQYTCMPNGRGRYRGRHPGLPRRRRNLHALRQCRQHRKGLEPHLRTGPGVRHGGRPRQGALQRFGRNLPARRAGTSGHEDRAEDVRRAGRGDGVLHLQKDEGRRLRRHPFDHGLYRIGRLRDLRGQRRRRQTLESALGGRRRVRTEEHRSGRARHAASGKGLLPLRQRHRRHHLAARSRAGLDHEIRRGQGFHRPRR